MKKSFLGYTTAFLFLLSACSDPSNDQQGKHEAHNHAAKEDKTENSLSKEIQINDAQLDAIYVQYLILTEALVDNDLKKAKIAANTIEAGAASLKNGASIKFSTAKITDATTINDGREAYSVLSNELVSMIKKTGMKNGEIFVGYCPMARDNQGGYWLSNNKSIQNPYYGESMLTCGEVKETIL